MLYQGNRQTIVRSRYARFLDNANTDMVMGFVPLPPGALLQKINYNYTTVGKESIPIEQAMETTLHAFIWTNPYPYHGYGVNMAGCDSLWDDVIPKDQDVDDDLESYTQDVVAGAAATSTSNDQGAIESGAFSDAGGETQFVAQTLQRGPKCIYSRVTRHDISNSIIADTNKMRPFDHVSSSIDRNFYVPRDQYAYVMFGVGAPKFEVVADGMGHQPTDDLQWNEIAYPELEHLMTMTGSLDEQDPNPVSRFQRHLETAEIESNTYEDNSGSAMTHWVSFLNLTVQYLRPKFPALAANSRLTRDT